jgi:O-antigen/teichoic acid export membrane protein
VRIWNAISQAVSNFVPRARLKGSFTNNTLWMIFGFGWRVGVQVFYFLIVARTLKPGEYGAFAGALALVLTISPFVSWGSGNILIKNVSRNSDSFHKYWGMALSVSLVTALFLAVLAMVSASLILSPRAAWGLAFPIILGDFFGERYAYTSSLAFLAFQKGSRTSLILASIGFYRLASAVLFILLPITKTAENWALLYMLSGLLSGATGLIWVARELGWGQLSLAPMRDEWLEGFYFSTSLSAQGAYNDLDKTLLNSLASSTVTGTYAAAYRIMDAAFIPARALIYAGNPRFFQEGKKGIGDAVKFAVRLLPWTLVSGLAAVLLLLLFAPLSPILLGKDYFETSIVLPWLALIPLFRSFHSLAADSLTGAGYQGVRTIIQIFIVVVNLVLNLVWIPRYSWKGAAWSSLLSDGVLAIILWGICLALIVRERRRTT